MFTNKIGERGRAKFTIEKTSNRYRFYVESPYLNSAQSVEGYIWPEGANPSNYLYNFAKYDTNKYIDYEDKKDDPKNPDRLTSIYINKNVLYHFHVYYYYSSTKIYLDEIAFRL